jgi:hypothetical protein
MTTRFPFIARQFRELGEFTSIVNTVKIGIFLQNRKVR